MPSTLDGLLLGPGLTQNWLEITGSTELHSPRMYSIHPGSWPSADLALPAYEITASPQLAAWSMAGKQLIGKLLLTNSYKWETVNLHMDLLPDGVPGFTRNQASQLSPNQELLCPACPAPPS